MLGTAQEKPGSGYSCGYGKLEKAARGRSANWKDDKQSGSPVKLHDRPQNMQRQHRKGCARIQGVCVQDIVVTASCRDDESMVATDDYRRTAGLRGSLRGAQQDNAHGTRLARYSGEAMLAFHNVNGANWPEVSSSQEGEAGHSKLTPMRSQDTEWMLVEPIPPKALATSLPPSPLPTACPTGPRFGEMNAGSVPPPPPPPPQEVEHFHDGANGHGSHSTPKSCRTSSSSMSLESKTTVGKEQFDRIRYQQPHTPSIESSILINRHEDVPGVSEENLKTLLKLRRRVQLLRIQIQGQRSVVEVKREALIDTDEQYIKRIRTNHVAKEFADQTNSTEALALENLWRLCQAARDSYGPAEDSLRSMENRLEVEEARLMRAEERLYHQLQSSQSGPDVTNHLQSEDETSSQDYGDGTVSEPDSTKSKPVGEVDYDDYLWRLGNLDLLQERHQGLLNEKSMLEEEQEKRRRVGMDLDVDSLDFLRHFEETLATLLTEIEEVSRDIERIKELCTKEGLMDAEGNPTQPSANSDGSGSNAAEEAQPELPTEHSKPSQHQNPSGSNEVDFRVSVNHEGFGPFINLWLLHKLRSSAMEILLLACCVAATVTNLDDLNWQVEALRLWEQDGACSPRPGPRWKSLESYVTTISRVHKITRVNKEDIIALWKKTRSLRSLPSRVSHNIKSLLRPKAQSTF